MNCQISKIYLNRLELFIISSKAEDWYSLSSIVTIDSVNLYESSKIKETNKKIIFAKIVELADQKITLELIEPSLFSVNKIVNLQPLAVESSFLPNILNQKIIYGEAIQQTSQIENQYEFIPTVQIGELVTQGQKIGYLNLTKSISNFKYWVLSETTGKVNKIGIGDYELGSLLATIDTQNVYLGNHNTNKIAGDLLLNIPSKNKYYKLDDNTQSASLDLNKVLKIKKGSTNIILDHSKKFLNTFELNQADLNNTVTIYLTCFTNFTPSSNKFDQGFIIFVNKYNLSQSLADHVSKLALEICELGFCVIIINQTNSTIKSTGNYKTINGEEVSITSIDHINSNKLNKNYFENIVELI